MMKLGIDTDYFYDFEAECAVKMLAAEELNNLELSSEHAEELMAKGNPCKTGRAFRKMADDLGVKLPQGHMLLSCNITAPGQDEITDHLKRWLELFLEIGIKAAVLHPGGRNLIQEGYDKKYVDERRACVLRPLADFVKGTELCICLENTPNTIPDARGLHELIDLVGSPHLGICLDTGHLNIKGGSQGDFIRFAGPRLKALHIHDNEGKEDQHILPFSCGSINWQEVVGALREIGYRHLFNFEIPMESRAPVPLRIAKLKYLKRLYEIMLNEVSAIHG